jgi:parvulin-like peptidyl-prolyl isomerase
MRRLLLLAAVLLPLAPAAADPAVPASDGTITVTGYAGITAAQRCRSS